MRDKLPYIAAVTALLALGTSWLVNGLRVDNYGAYNAELMPLVTLQSTLIEAFGAANLETVATEVDAWAKEAHRIDRMVEGITPSDAELQPLHAAIQARSKSLAQALDALARAMVASDETVRAQEMRDFESRAAAASRSMDTFITLKRAYVSRHGLPEEGRPPNEALP